MATLLSITTLIPLLTAPSTVSVVTGVVILSPIAILADISVASVSTVRLDPSVAPFTSSPVKAAVAVGYIFSPGILIGADPITGPTCAVTLDLRIDKLLLLLKVN